jgi:hypothetical protein
MFTTALAWAGGLWLKAKPQILLWGAIAVAVIAALLWARSSGRSIERVRQLERDHEAAKQRARNEAAIAGASDPELDDWLRPPGRRRRR